MRRHTVRDRHDAHARALRGPGPGPETFYDHTGGPASGTLTVTVAGLAALALVLSGAITVTRDADGAGTKEEPGTLAHRRFLADLPAHRPPGESVVSSGVSRPGASVFVDTRSLPARPPHRIAYRCQGTGGVTATALAPDGTRHRLPPVACGPAITSLAVEDHRSVTLTGDDPGALLLWAVTTAPHGRPGPS
ncbi:hypothetical protein [Streptomyces sp. NPDC096068]|uniref:hypothetical protein n=1 Tax=Streptomyces sp. NPDC096068 TaxID=3155424 RepID=UPI00332F90E2